jgi:hypothetical protein
VLEDREERLHAAPAHPRIQTYWLARSESDEVLKRIAWEYLFLPMEFRGSHPAIAKLRHYVEGSRLLAADVRDLGQCAWRNLERNASLLHRARLGQGLAGMFRGVPAVVCGAGPSLTHALPDIARKAGGALIFAGGSALALLSDYALVPHFGALVDPDPPLVRFLQHTAFEAPLFYHNRAAASLLQRAHGPLLWMPENEGYALEEWLRAQWGLRTPSFDGGWNAATCCVAAAVLLGCAPVYLAGVDLCTQRGRLYAEGIEEAEGGLVPVEDAQGAPAYARRDWLMARDWLSACAQTHPENAITKWGAQGLALPGIPSCSSIEPSLERDLCARVHAAVQALPPALAGDQKAELPFEKMRSSLRRVARCCDALLNHFQRAFPHSPCAKGAFALAEVELEEEAAYQRVLEPLWAVWRPAIAHRLSAPTGYDSALYVNKLLFFKKIIEQRNT